MSCICTYLGKNGLKMPKCFSCTKESHKKWLLKNPTYYRDRQRKIKKGQWKTRWNILTKEQNKKYVEGIK